MSSDKEKLPDFEESLAELESLVQKLESGDLTLDESLDYFKKGVELTRQCQKVLNEAQQTVEKFLDNGEDSATEPFTPDD